MKKQTGFTLIELLLALAVIGIVTAIAAPAYLGQRARTRDQAAMANAQALVGDLVAGYDQCRELGLAMNSPASFTTHVLGTASLPRIPAYWRTRNPWSPRQNGYGEVLTETSVQGDVTRGKAAPATLGQVQVGYLPAGSSGPGCLVTAVYLRRSLGEGQEGGPGHVYATVCGLD
jgi:prepilin-type N-terminal cleavage/methylation domain-containing protein